MNTEAFDAIIVGAGQAGPAIAARCSREGLKTAVIERHHFGGTCVNVGCVPTKTLVASAGRVRLRRGGPARGHGPCDGAQGRHRREVARGGRGLDARLEGHRGHPRRCMFRRPVHAGGGWAPPERAAHLPQCRRACRTPHAAGHSHREDAGQRVGDGAGRGARASGDRRRQLHRPGVRAVDAPAGRRRDGGGAFRKTAATGGRRRVRRHPSDPRSRRRALRAGRRVPVAGTRGRAHRGRCRLWGWRGHHRQPCAAGRRPPAQHRRPGAGTGRHPHGRPRLHRGRRSMPHQRRRRVGRGRLQRAWCLHAYVMERPRDRGGEPVRRRPAPHQRPHPLLRALHRPGTGPRRHDGDRSPGRCRCSASAAPAKPARPRAS